MARDVQTVAVLVRSVEALGRMKSLQAPRTRLGSALALTGSLLAGAVMVVTEPLGPSLPAIIFLGVAGVSLWFLTVGLKTWLDNRDPHRPVEPRPLTASRRSLPPEPRGRIHELADYCVICGRPLTNLQSQIARVGTTCIKRYGPRFKMVPNPEHEKWRDAFAAAEAERATEQLELDAGHRDAMRHFADLVREWEDERKSPPAQTRRQLRKVARTQILLGFLTPFGMFFGIAMVLPAS